MNGTKAKITQTGTAKCRAQASRAFYRLIKNESSPKRGLIH